jgi:hypothetical protein
MPAAQGSPGRTPTPRNDEPLRRLGGTRDAQAASALLAYLTRFPVQQGSAEDWAVTPFEDMTPDQLAFAEAWANRQVNRAMRRLEGMQRAQAAPLDHAAQATDERDTRATRATPALRRDDLLGGLISPHCSHPRRSGC